MTVGSSPLARGTLMYPALLEYLDGLIPARAGNTAVRIGSFLGHRAHPRSRGEHAVMRTSPWQTRGSSPLARGTH